LSCKPRGAGKRRRDQEVKGRRRASFAAFPEKRDSLLVLAFPSALWQLHRHESGASGRSRRARARTAREAISYQVQLGQKNRKGLEATFKSYDKNGDGTLSREEYIDPWAKSVTPPPTTSECEPQ
jgi:hypothetical protein